MDKWEQAGEEFISENFSVSHLHEFMKPGSNFCYGTSWNWEGLEDNEEWRTKALYCNRFDTLDEMVRYSRTNFLPCKDELKLLLTGKGKAGEEPRAIKR